MNEIIADPSGPSVGSGTPSTTGSCQAAVERAQRAHTGTNLFYFPTFVSKIAADCGCWERLIVRKVFLSSDTQSPETNASAVRTSKQWFITVLVTGIHVNTNNDQCLQDAIFQHEALTFEANKWKLFKEMFLQRTMDGIEREVAEESALEQKHAFLLSRLAELEQKVKERSIGTVEVSN